MSALMLTAAAAAASFVPPSFTAEQLRQLVAAPTDNSAAVVIDVQVDPKGRTSNCKTIAISGNGALVSGTCARVEQIRVRPAAVLGQPAYGVLHQQIGVSNGDVEVLEPSDIEVQVNVLPAGQRSLRVVANVLVDTAGRPQACYANNAPAGYGDLACSQVSGITFGALKDKDGKAVQYVRTVVVDFVKSAG